MWRGSSAGAGRPATGREAQGLHPLACRLAMLCACMVHLMRHLCQHHLCLHHFDAQKHGRQEAVAVHHPQPAADALYQFAMIRLACTASNTPRPGAVFC